MRVERIRKETWEKSEEIKRKKKERDEKVKERTRTVTLNKDQQGETVIEQEERVPETWEERWTEDDEVVAFGLRVFDSLDSVNARMETLRRLLRVLQVGDFEVGSKVPMDGNCFFHVVGRIMGQSHLEIRKKAVDNLARKLNDQSWWKGILGDTERDVRYFLRKQREIGEWADHVVILGTAQALGVDITIWGESGRTVVNGGEEGVGRRQVHVGYVQDTHYFEVVKLVGQVEGEQGQANQDGSRGVEREEHEEVGEGERGVFNLGVQGLTEDMKRVLDLGAKFVPVQKVNLSKLFADIERLRNNLLWKICWAERAPEVDDEAEGEDNEIVDISMEERNKQRELKFGSRTNAAPRQGLIPKRLEDAVDRYVEAVKDSIVKGLKRKPEDNLDIGMKEALTQIQGKVRGGEWAIRPADKGGGLTVEKKAWIVEDGRKELRKEDTYEETEKTQVKKTADRVKKKLQEMAARGVISEKLLTGLQVKHPKAGTLKLNRKIHKQRNGNGRYPWRAYVSGIGTATEGIAGLVEWELDQGVRGLHSFVEDSSDFLRQLKEWGPLQQEDFMFTVDVVNMYPSIPRDSGREAMRRNLASRTDLTIPTEDLLELADLVLESNEIEFEGGRATQIDGTAIGSKLGKNYSCTFMGEWEKKTQEKAERRLGKRPLLWKRFVDDGFGVWRGTVEEFQSFMLICNQEDLRINITYEICREKAVFLDVEVIKQRNGNLKTTLYVKPTDRQRYLHVDSDHPNHTKKGIAKGQLKRLKRICSEEADFQRRASELKKNLMKRGYGEKGLKRELQNARSWSREDALKKVEREKTDKKVNFVLTHSAYLPNVSKIMRDNFHHMRIEGLEGVFEEPPRVSLRKGRSIGNMVMDQQPEKGRGSSGRCGGCKLCPNMKMTQTFRDQEGRTFDIRTVMTCESVGVVYGMECKKCQKIVYVGKTCNSLRERFYGHRSDFTRKDMEAPISHFMKEGHAGWEDMNIIGIEQVRGKDDTLRIVRERFWMKKLGVLGEENRRL